MLKIVNNVVVFEICHDISGYNMLHNFTTDACKRYRTLIYCFIFSPSLYVCTTFACFQSLCISSDSSDFEKKIEVKIGATCSFNYFTMQQVGLDYIKVFILQLMISSFVYNILILLNLCSFEYS